MISERAAANLRERLSENPYPGRGIVIGRDPAGGWIQVYWIMGRSANSRNRIFVGDGDLLRTQAADPAKVDDPSLIIYNAMRVCGRRYIVTNGVQTDDVYDAFAAGRGFVESLDKWFHEPDPNYTPRISGYLDLDTEEVWLSILKVSPFDTEQSERHFFRFDCIEPGYGYAITTYAGDGDPLPSFAGTPYLLPLAGDPADFWQVLNEDNRIALAVRRIAADGTVETQITNRYEAV